MSPKVTFFQTSKFCNSDTMTDVLVEK